VDGLGPGAALYAWLGYRAGIASTMKAALCLAPNLTLADARAAALKITRSISMAINPKREANAAMHL